MTYLGCYLYQAPGSLFANRKLPPARLYALHVYGRNALAPLRSPIKSVQHDTIHARMGRLHEELPPLIGLIAIQASHRNPPAVDALPLFNTRDAAQLVVHIRIAKEGNREA